MVKEIIWTPGRSFREFSLLPDGETTEECTIQRVSLETRLAGLTLKIPLMSAAMTSVTGYEMALALGKEGGIGILPARLRTEEQADIVRRIKNYEMGLVNPIRARAEQTVEEVLREVQRLGHSKIPIVNEDNVFLGMFEQQHYLENISASPKDSVIVAMIPADKVPRCDIPDITVEEARALLESKGVNYLVVLEGDKLRRLAFRKDVEKIKVGAAISTYPGWKERVKANVDAGVDLIVIDTSDAYNIFTKRVIEEYKALGITVPLCAGNIVTFNGAIYLMDAGADMVKVGMSSGSICTSAREKAVGRAPVSALLDVLSAQREYQKRAPGRYVPVIVDGGIARSADMIVALTMADAIMMGGYFNHFYEAAGEKFDESGNQTTEEDRIRFVATWGEGSQRAQNMDRYGQTRKTFFEEGIEGKVPYRGRLKPYLKKDLMKIRSALSNAGCKNLEEFRKNSVLELLSLDAQAIVSSTHDVSTK